MSEKYSGNRARLRGRASFCSALLALAVIVSCLTALPIAGKVQAMGFATPPLRVIFLEGNGQSEGTPIELPRETLQQIQVTGGTVYLSSELWDEPQNSSLVPASLDPALNARAAELAMGLPTPLPRNGILIDFDGAFDDATIGTQLPGRTLLAYQANDGMAYTTDYLYAVHHPGEFRLQQLFAHLTRDEITEDQLYLYYSPSDGTELEEDTHDEHETNGEAGVTTPEEGDDLTGFELGEETPGAALGSPAPAPETPAPSESTPAEPEAEAPKESTPSESNEDVEVSEPSETQPEVTDAPTEETTTGPTTTNPDLITVISKSPEEQLQEDLKEQLAGFLQPQVKEDPASTDAPTEGASIQAAASSTPTAEEDDADPVAIVELKGEELERVAERALPEATDDAADPADEDELQKTTETGTPDEVEDENVSADEGYLYKTFAADSKLNQRFQTLAEATHTLESYLPDLPDKNAFAARVQQRRVEELLEELEQQVSTQEQRELYHHAEVILQQSEQKLQINSTVVIVGETGESLHEPLILGGSLLGLALLITLVARRKRRQY